jgi:hypothetical protein
MEPMKRIAAVALAALAMAATPTQAADLFGTAAPPMSVAENPAVEIGSNWYIRGDIGASIDNVPSLAYSNLTIPPAGNAYAPTPPQLGANGDRTNFLVDIGLG